MILQSRLIYTHVKLDFEVNIEKCDDCLFVGTFLKIQKKKNVEHFNRRCTVTGFIVCVNDFESASPWGPFEELG